MQTAYLARTVQALILYIECVIVIIKYSIEFADSNLYKFSNNV